MTKKKEKKWNKKKDHCLPYLPKKEKKKEEEEKRTVPVDAVMLEDHHLAMMKS